MPSMRMPGLKMRRPAGYPADRTAGRWVFDVLVTLVAVVAAGPSVHPRRPPPAGGGRRPCWPCRPRRCVVRRIWPVPVFGRGAGPERRGRPVGPRGQRPGPAHRPVHRGRAAAAPGGAGLRGPARAGRGHRAVPVRGQRLVVRRDLRVRHGRRRPRARPVLRHPPRLPGRAARPRGAAGTGAGPAGRAGRGRRTRPDRPRDARHRRPPPHRHGHPERRGGRGVGRLAGAGHRRHAQRVGHRAPRPGRYPPAARRAAPAPRPGPRRESAAGPGPGPARRAHRAGPVGRAGHHAGDPRGRARRARRGAAHRVPARAGGPHQHPQARRRGRPRRRAAAVPPRRAARRHRRRRRGRRRPGHRERRRRPGRHAGTGPRLRRRRAGRAPPARGLESLGAPAGPGELDGGDAA